jgi:hypothetical protein
MIPPIEIPHEEFGELLRYPLGFGDKLWYDKMQERDLGERA